MIAKIDEAGKVCIPKKLREKYNLIKGIPLTVTDDGGVMILAPRYKCPKCGKALSEKYAEHDACPYCDRT